jgi:hypothetical protein
MATSAAVSDELVAQFYADVGALDLLGGWADWQLELLFKSWQRKEYLLSWRDCIGSLDGCKCPAGVTCAFFGPKVDDTVDTKPARGIELSQN